VQSSKPHDKGFSELNLIGSGGFSRVYSARQDEFGRSVAVKVLKFRLESDDERQSFEAECRAMAQLSDHPNIVSLYSTTYTADRFPVIVMQLFTGGTLNDQAPVTPEVALDAGVKVASALHFAHQQGVIHRDVKPKNVLLSQFGEPALTDFGISAITEREHTEANTGITLAYAPPEALTGVADARSDIYSLAATLYAVLAGHHPHQSVGTKQDRTELARKILYEDPPPLRRLGLSSRYDSVLVRQGLAKEPTDRPPDAQAFAEMMRDLQRTEHLPVTAFAAATPTSNPSTLNEATPATDQDPSVTIVRTGRGGAAEPEPEPDETGWSTRQLVAAGAGAMAIGLLAMFLLFGRGTPTAQPEMDLDTPTLEPAEPDIDIFVQPMAPANVEINRQPDGSVIVTWDDPNRSEVVFEIQRIDGDSRADPPIKATGTSHVIDGIPLTTVPCITMRAVSDDGSGKISRDIDTPACQPTEIGTAATISLVPPACAPGACSFRIQSDGFLLGSMVTVLVEGTDGQDLNSAFGNVYPTSAEVGREGALNWRFAPQGQAPTGQYRVVVTDQDSGERSVGFFELTEP